MKKILILSLCFFAFSAYGIKAESVSEVTGLKVIKRTGHTISVKWNKIDAADKYQVRVQNAKGKTKGYKETTNNKTKVRKLKPNKTYSVSVRAVNGEKKGTYCEPEKTETKPVASITLAQCAQAACDNNEHATANVCWTVDGYSSMGFKLVWSQNPAPEYPSRTADYYVYYSDPKTTQGEVTDTDNIDTYYVRVCEYLGGKCGVYSNEIAVEL